MLSLSRLLCGTVTSGDALRSNRQSADLPPHLLHFSEDKRPVVVWNVTRRCNLHCVHCYASATDKPYEGELSTAEALGVILDGLEDIHDKFRGKKGAFADSIKGIRACREAGVRVGVRFTVTKRNQHHLADVLNLLEEEDIPR